MLSALRSARGAELLAIASRDAARAQALAVQFGVPRVHRDYAALLADPEVEAVYLPLPNSLHREWALRALAAGKHVLCEKPLALNAVEAEEMAAGAARSGRLLMEAVMYRFHPRVRELIGSAAGGDIRHVYACFGFPMDRAAGLGGGAAPPAAAANYRLRLELGGGALLDVGCYLADVTRWLLGEPDRVEAVMVRWEGGVDVACTAVLGFPGGAQAALHASFDSPEVQELVVVCTERVLRLQTPFTAWRDPHDPYQLMVEAFIEAVLAGRPPPVTLGSSIANMRLLDRIREAAR